MSTRQADPYGRGSYCIVVALHGTDSTEAESLRAFRDRILSRLPCGPAAIDLYYRASPAVTAWLSGRPLAERVLATTISTIARPMAVLR